MGEKGDSDSVGLCLVLWKEADMMGDKAGRSCRSKTFSCTFSNPKDPAGHLASREAGLQGEKTLPGVYNCSSWKLLFS